MGTYEENEKKYKENQSTEKTDRGRPEKNWDITVTKII